MEWLRPAIDYGIIGLLIIQTTIVIPVELPKASKGQSDTLKTQTIEIDKRGNLYLNSRPVTLNGLKESICSLDRSVPMLIRADRDIALQVFVDVLDVVKKLGFKRVSLQTEQRRA